LLVHELLKALLVEHPHVGLRMAIRSQEALISQVSDPPADGRDRISSFNSAEHSLIDAGFTSPKRIWLEFLPQRLKLGMIAHFTRRHVSNAPAKIW